MMPAFPLPVDDFLFAVCKVLKTDGRKSEVSILAAQKDLSPQVSGFRGRWKFVLTVPVEVFAQTSREEWAELEARIDDAFVTVLTGRGSDVVHATIVPEVAKAPPNWRPRAEQWATGRSLSNQGRVRSDNVAAISKDGLLFRSASEVSLFSALRRKNVTLAPLPVFVRGNGSRFEPDFLIIYEGIVLVVEVDGDTFHPEKPVDAHERLEVLTHEGVKAHRIRAASCSNEADADLQADRILEVLKKYKSSSR